MTGEMMKYVGGGLLAILVIVGIIALARTSQPPAIAVAPLLTQPGPFAFAVPLVQGGVEVWIRYAVAFPYSPQPGAQPHRYFCLVLELLVDGQRLVLGHGGTHPPDTENFEGLIHHDMSWSPGSETTPSRYSATVLVKRFPVCPRSLSGVLHVAKGTMLQHAQVSLSKSR
jgi:hypothetical protein